MSDILCVILKSLWIYNQSLCIFIVCVVVSTISYQYEVEALDELNSDHRPVKFLFSIPASLPSVLHPPVINWDLYTGEVRKSAIPFTEINSRADLHATAAKLTKTLFSARETAKSDPPVEYIFNKFPMHIKKKIKLRNRVRKDWQRTSTHHFNIKQKGLECRNSRQGLKLAE